MLICSSEGERARQGHYEAKRSEIAEKDEVKLGWYRPKQLRKSPSGTSSCQKLHQGRTDGSATHQMDWQ